MNDDDDCDDCNNMSSHNLQFKQMIWSMPAFERREKSNCHTALKQHNEAANVSVSSLSLIQGRIIFFLCILELSIVYCIYACILVHHHRNISDDST